MELEQEYDGFTRNPKEDKVTIKAIGANWAGERQSMSFEVYVYSGNPMPGKDANKEDFVCLGKEGMYKFMLLDDLKQRIIWDNPPAPPGCYQKDRDGTSGLRLWELEGDRWEIPKDGERRKKWFKDIDGNQWNTWAAKATTAQNSNTLLGFPKFARFWIPRTTSHFVFEPVDSDSILKKKLEDGMADLKLKWTACPPSLTWEVVALGHGNKNGRVLWATHYLGFYKIWVSPENHRDLLVERKDNNKWPFPDQQRASDMDVNTLDADDPTATLFADPYDTQYSTITKDKMDNASGKRTFVRDQTKVMHAAPGLMYQTLNNFTELPTALPNGLWPAEWLHRSAFSFGGLGASKGVSKDYETSQVRGNLVLGTSESNTYMILLENAIADYATRTKKTGRLVTSVRYDYVDQFGSPHVWDGPKYTWLVPKLQYNFIPDKPITFGTTQVSICTSNVETFSRRLTNSLEARASYYFLARMYPTDD